MPSIFFFEGAQLARSVAQMWTQRNLSVAPASTASEVETLLQTIDVDAILVPHKAIVGWLLVEDRLWTKITMPRIIVVKSEEKANLWTTQVAESCGFDGYFVVDRTSGPILNAERARRAIEATVTAGARKPEKLHELAISATLEEITDGDEINLQILRLLYVGRTYEEIAESVYLAAQTVRNRASKMLLRADVRNRSELVITYLQLTARDKLMSLSSISVLLMDFARSSGTI